MRFALVIVLALSACTEFDVFVEAAGDEGTVYECASESSTVELCYLDDSEAELANWLVATKGGAWSCGTTDRWWPRITNALHSGCNYHCPHPGPGCNSKNGCFCP